MTGRRRLGLLCVGWVRMGSLLISEEASSAIEAFSLKAVSRAGVLRTGEQTIWSQLDDGCYAGFNASGLAVEDKGAVGAEEDSWFESLWEVGGTTEQGAFVRDVRAPEAPALRPGVSPVRPSDSSSHNTPRNGTTTPTSEQSVYYSSNGFQFEEKVDSQLQPHFPSTLIPAYCTKDPGNAKNSGLQPWCVVSEILLTSFFQTSWSFSRRSGIYPLVKCFIMRGCTVSQVRIALSAVFAW